MRKKHFLYFFAVFFLLFCISCATSKAPQLVQAEFIPAEPNYDDNLMWFTQEDDSTGSGADIFYLVSTWEIDWKTDDGKVCHYADVWNKSHRDHMAIEISRVASYMASGNRFYSPYYRHITIDGWVTQDEALIKNRARLAMEDVCKAFDHFQSRRDKSRPLIIAGFSQGGLATVELLKHMSDESYKQLAAAYVMGYKKTLTNAIT